MAIAANIQVTGLKELEAKLKALGSAQGKKIVRQGLRAGAKPIQAKAKQIAPKLTGKLSKSIKVRAAKSKSKTRLSVVVTTSGTDNLFTGETFYGGFVELGHFMGKRLRGRFKGREAYNAASAAAGRKFVPGRHFMRQAADAAAGAAVAAFVEKLKAGIAAVMSK